VCRFTGQPPPPVDEMPNWETKIARLWLNLGDFSFGVGATCAPANRATFTSGVQAPDSVMGEPRWEAQWSSETVLRGRIFRLARSTYPHD